MAKTKLILIAGALIASAGVAFAVTQYRAEQVPVLRVANQKGQVKAMMLASGALDGASYKVEWSEFPAAQPLLEAVGGGAADLGLAADAPYLLVSVGTGTSVLRVEGADVARVGGTALGGGTLMGLSGALTGKTDYEEICRLAEKGDRGRVDLRVGDLYAENEIQLPGETTAAAFGKLALPSSKAPSVEDLAAAILGLVGENVALIGCGIAYATGVRRLVYGGGTLHDNPVLVSVLQAVTSMAGCEPVLLEHGTFAGAVGALDSAADG